MDLYTIAVRLDKRGLVADVKDSEKSVERLGVSGDNAGKKMAGGMKNATTAAHTLKTALGPIAVMLAGIGAAFAAAISVKKVSEQMRAVYALGASLEHLKNATGVGVGELIKWRQAVMDAGGAADTADKMLVKLSKELEQGGKNLTAMGVRLRDSSGNMRDLHAIAADTVEALNKYPDVAAKSGQASVIFGEDISFVNAALNLSKKSIDDAANSVGRFAEKMEKNSVRFERIDTLLGRMKTSKIPQLFAGLSESFGVELERILTAIDSADFTSLGERIGEGSKGAVDIFKEAWGKGQIPELMFAVVQVGLDGIKKLMAVSTKTAWESFKLNAVDTFGSIGAALRAALETAIGKAAAAMASVFSEIAKFQADMWMRVPGMEGRAQKFYTKSAELWGKSQDIDSQWGDYASNYNRHEATYRDSARKLFGVTQPEGDQGFGEVVGDYAGKIKGLMVPIVDESKNVFTKVTENYQASAAKQMEVDAVKHTESLKQTKSWMDSIQNYFNSAKDEIAEDIDAGLSALLRGKKSFTDVFNDILDSLLQSMTEHVIQSQGGGQGVGNWIANTLVSSFAGSMGAGGGGAGAAAGGASGLAGASAGASMSGMGAGAAGAGAGAASSAMGWMNQMFTGHAGGDASRLIRRYHTGGYPGESVAVIREGESILTRDQKQVMEEGSAGKQPNVNVLVAFTEQDLRDMTTRYPDAILAPLAQNRRQVRAML